METHTGVKMNPSYKIQPQVTGVPDAPSDLLEFLISQLGFWDKQIVKFWKSALWGGEKY